MQGGQASMKGRFYGKVIDAATNKGLEFATVRLNRIVKDSVTQEAKEELVTGVISQANGEFSIEQVPLFGKYVVIVSAIGYQSKNIQASFPKPEQGKPPVTEKDLGNIKLCADTIMLQELVVEGKDPQFVMAIDKKIFNVQENTISEGGTAEDVLKTVPSVDVDMDGNVSLRNSSPQIFVDGKLSPLSLDQIPADLIQSIEIITNPSAKYDASGGGGGIINIVLKKERRIGFNGSVRAGADMWGRVNSGIDLNIREGKFNFFGGVNLRQSKSLGFNETIRENFFGKPFTQVNQQNESIHDREFRSGNIGVDYFLTNSHTITLSSNIFSGRVKLFDELEAFTDTLRDDYIGRSSNKRISDTKRRFNSYSYSLLYKYLFPKTGRELTADISYRDNTVNFGGDFETSFYTANKEMIGSPSLQKQDGGSKNSFIVGQSDYVSPLNEKMKIETGIRYSYREFSSRNDNFMYNETTQLYELLPSFSANYSFTDQIYASYATFTHQLGKFGYQMGIRTESSDYKGVLTETGETFRTAFPLSIFPTAFIDYKLNDEDNIQLNYSRRINRPGFFNLLPFIDYTDSLNLSRGNPALKPEFTHSVEVSYMNAYGKRNNLLISAYFKNTEKLITRYQLVEFNDVLNKTVVMNTYQNATNAYAYGFDITNKWVFVKWWETTINLNVFQSVIQAQNIEANLQNALISYFAKVNNTLKLPWNMSLQISANYHSPRALQQASSGMDRGGWGGFSASSVQGYTEGYAEIDFGLKKSFLKNAASVSINVSDAFKTRTTNTIIESTYFTQTNNRVRDQQFFRISASYRFGKFDSSIFKRRNTRGEGGGMDM